MELINKEELRDKMYHEAFEVDTELQKWESGCWIRYKLFEKVLDEMPTMESRPKGKWLGISYDGYADGNPVYTEWECSNCGLEINDDNGEILWDYCPDCGADMRGEE